MKAIRKADNTTKSWWLETWYCSICKTQIRKHHRARHLESKMHKRLIGEQYEWKDSDRAFTQFLATIDTRKFSRYERRLYKTLKEVSHDQKMHQSP